MLRESQADSKNFVLVRRRQPRPASALAVTFTLLRVGHFDDATRWLEPIENPFGP